MHLANLTFFFAMIYMTTMGALRIAISLANDHPII